MRHSRVEAMRCGPYGPGTENRGQQRGGGSADRLDTAGALAALRDRIPVVSRRL